MTIKLKEGDISYEDFRQKLLAWFACTRFVINEIYCEFKPGSSKRYCVHLLSVRLKRPTFYYGFGPHERPVMQRSGWGSRTRLPCRVRFLGGRDWIEFNDLLNDFMDEHKVVGDIATAHCVIRRGNKRRISYNASPVTGKTMWPTGAWSWDRVPANSNHFVAGRSCPILPFSSCNAEPAGNYKMLGDITSSPP